MPPSRAADSVHPARVDHGAAAVDVVIVTARGSWPLLRDCLGSLREFPALRPFRVFVLDNASDDGTVEAARESFPEAEVVALADNRGFAHASNRGIRLGTAPYVMLLNPDTLAKPMAIETLCRVLDERPEAGVVGPRLVGLDGSPDHNAKRSFPSPQVALEHFLGRRSYGRGDVPEFGSAVVESVSGSCMLVRRSALGQVGLLDEGYFMYGEDLDWCRRFGAAGWEVRYEGSATIVHVKHGITGRHRALRTNWAFHRSMGRFYRKFDAGRNPALDGAVYAGVLLKFVVSAALSSFARRFS